MVLEDLISMDFDWLENIGTMVAESVVKTEAGKKFKVLMDRRNLAKLREEAVRVAAEYASSGNMDPATVELLTAKGKDYREFHESFLYAVLCSTPPSDTTWFVTEKYCPAESIRAVKRDMAVILARVRDKVWRDPDFRERLSQPEINQFVIDTLALLRDKVQAPAIVGGYPAPTRAFVGREREIGNIITEALEGRPVFVHGVRGIGKTEMCKAACRRLDNMGHTVAWMDYSNSMEETVATRLAAVCLRSADSGDVSKVYEEKLVAMRATDGLVVVVDNFPEGGKAAELMRFGVPTIVTTGVPPSGGNHSKVEVKALYQEEAFELLCRVAGDKYRPWIESNRAAFEDLIGKVGCHTLVVSLLGGLVAKGEPLRSDPFDEIIDLENIAVEDYDTGEELPVMDHVRRIFGVSSLEGIPR